MGKLVQSKKKNISMNLKGTPGPLWTSKNKNHLCRKATMLVYSEFDADSEYIWFFLKNILGKKMTLSILVLSFTLKKKLRITMTIVFFPCFSQQQQYFPDAYWGSQSTRFVPWWQRKKLTSLCWCVKWGQPLMSTIEKKTKQINLSC
jgi:hypothetical protein